MGQFKRLPVTPAEKAEAFKAWYSAQGHWVYDTRAEAVRVWRDRGIIGRPQHTAEAEAILAPWLHAERVLQVFDDLTHADRRASADHASEVRRAARGAL